jgi:sigma-E factor negative regulatory protein RseB
MHSSRVISIEAKDNYRYGRKIWIDKQHNLPLKVEVSDLSGNTLEQVIFTDLQIGHKLFNGDVENKLKNLDIKHIHQLESLPLEKADFVLKNLPSGFHIVFFTRMKMDKSDQFVDHLLLSDGFSSISVYREAKAVDSREGLQTLGTVNSFTHIVKNNQITAMGEVPAKTVQFIAQGVKFL